MKDNKMKLLSILCTIVMIATVFSVAVKNVSACADEEKDIESLNPDVATNEYVHIVWQENLTGNYEIDDSRCLFIEKFTKVHGEVIQGNVNVLCVEYLTYNFNPAEKMLTAGWGYPIVNESLIGIYGEKESIYGDVGSTDGGWLFGVYSLPCYFNGTIARDYYSLPYELVIKEICENGTVYLIYNGTEIILSPNESWNCIAERLRIDGENVTKFTFNTTITNYGFIDKSKIRLGEDKQKDQNLTLAGTYGVPALLAIVTLLAVILAFILYKRRKTKKC